MEPTEMAENSPVWHEIVIEDPLHLTGQSTHEFLKKILSLFSLDWVYFRNFDGAFRGLNESKSRVVPVEEFLPLVIEADQYDWGNIFLSARPVRDDPETLSDLEMISCSEISLFLVDDQYFYIYTADGDVAAALSRDVNMRSTAEKTIDDIVIPS